MEPVTLGLVTAVAAAVAAATGAAEGAAVATAFALAEAAGAALLAAFAVALVATDALTPPPPTNDLLSIQPGETLPTPDGNSTKLHSLPSVATRVTADLCSRS